ncbi:sporulation initiation factor Spo0A C-terminal domain-containing protein [Pseudoflavonifractor phocaeensis]|nr:sporulation initiation factor Spo0A C-terminal domain-containing protein [Pseudoflavonifractor phocaeensis]
MNMSCHDTLKRLGVTPNYIGYHQTISAVELARRDPDSLFLVTKSLYPMVAKPYGTSWKTLERNIRSVVSMAWERNPDLVRELAGYPMEDKPRAAQFIAILADQP